MGVDLYCLFVVCLLVYVGGKACVMLLSFGYKVLFCLDSV